MEEERGNYSTWRYRVEWACGARCRGEARVAAEARGEGAGGAALRHRVVLHVRTCSSGALPWRAVCGEHLEVVGELGSIGR